jgi:Reverse transcriptase (RNA-dependent DNA polymerase)
MIFNIVLDRIIKAWSAAEAIQTVFYADNGLLQTEDEDLLQEALDGFMEYFKRVGLAMNADKTKSMIAALGPILTGLTSPVYKFRMMGEGGTERERRALKVNCPVCQMELRATSLRRHMEHVHEDWMRTQGPLLARLFGGTNEWLGVTVVQSGGTTCVHISCGDIPTMC